MGLFGSSNSGLFGGGLGGGKGFTPEPIRLPRENTREGRKMVERGIKKVSPAAGEALEQVNNLIDTIENGQEALERNRPFNFYEQIVKTLSRHVMDQSLNKADHLYVHRGVYSHHGLNTGEAVIHYSEGRVRTDSLGEFSKGAYIEVRNSALRYSADEVIRRAYSRIGESKYNLLFNNCEHFVNWCRNGD